MSEQISTQQSLPTLRRVQWVNVWQHVQSFSGDAGTRAHLTSESGLSGKTLCGRSYPADKGFYSPHKYCKRCVKRAYALGFGKGFTKNIDFVPSRSSD